MRPCCLLPVLHWPMLPDSLRASHLMLSAICLLTHLDILVYHLLAGPCEPGRAKVAGQRGIAGAAAFGGFTAREAVFADPSTATEPITRRRASAPRPHSAPRTCLGPRSLA